MIRPAALLWLALTGASFAGEAILDARTGELIAGFEADRQRFPASTTKLMTIFVAMEAAARGEVELTEEITVSDHAAAAPPVKLGLKTGEAIRLDQAIHAALILSSNDAARVIAEAVAGTEEAFARRMTETARRLGMRNSDFRNASGLPDANHVSTAADIGRLILRLDQAHGAYLRPLFRAPLVWRGGMRRPRNGTVASLPGARLGKTGFTCAAGYTAAILLDAADGARAIATMANSGAAPRAVSLRRLAQGNVGAHAFTPPCGGAPKTPKPKSKPAIAQLGDWSLTLGVFSEKAEAIERLRESRHAAPKAVRVVATRQAGHGFYAMVLADSLDQAQALQARFGNTGMKANLVDRSGRRALGLRAISGQ